MSANTLFIINPVSGPPAQRLRAAQLQSLLADKGIVADVAETEFAGHATVLATDAINNKIQRIIAVGGDGTVNEIARTVQGTDVKLGIVPRGSGNGLARHLLIPMNLDKALAVIKADKSLAIDAGVINGKSFFCTAGIGFDGFISKVFATSLSRGLATYAKLAITHFFKYKPLPVQIVLDGKAIATHVFVLAFGNAAQYGNNAYIAPLADIQDGLLDVCMIRKLTLPIAVEVGMGLWLKRISTSKQVRYSKCQTVIANFKAPCCFHIDGEYAGEDTHFEIEIKPKCLQVIQPFA